MVDRHVFQLWRPLNGVAAAGEAGEFPEDGVDRLHAVELDVVDGGRPRIRDDIDDLEAETWGDQ